MARQFTTMLQQPGIERMPDVGQHAKLGAARFDALQGQCQVIVITRRLGLRRHGAVDDQYVQGLAPQPVDSCRGQARGVGEIGDTPALPLQQITERQLGMLQR